MVCMHFSLTFTHTHHHYIITQVLAEDKLFATLDPTTRRTDLPSGKQVLFTDTVGM